MKLLVGLGNPGPKYARHRHNIGFMALDRIADDYGFAPWKTRFRGLVAEGRLGNAKALLLKPETFMNNSGQAVGEAMRYYKLTPEDVIVLHDEIDLAPAKVRFKQGGGHAGHNGLRSVHAHIGEAYGRVRMGVGHPGRKELVPAYVLHDFARADQDWLDDVLRGVSDGAPHLATGDSGKFMNAVSLRIAPPRSSTSAGNSAPGKGGIYGQSGGKTGAKSGPANRVEPETAPVDPRSPLQKLMERFR